MASEITPVQLKASHGSALLQADESLERVDTARFPSLRPAFKSDGSITAGNASSLSDGRLFALHG